jgi:dolichol-phosphate mannosyltransferase
MLSVVPEQTYVIILPTYNESENLPTVIAAIEQVRQETPTPGHVLVVDDNSPDGTGDVADELAAKHEWVHVLHRPGKQGLGQAYIAGFRWALARDYTHILEMDCDLSHPPAAIPRLLAAAEVNDLVLGSRYVPGGGVVGWPLHRRVISQGGSLYARGCLGVGIHDLTGGFKCFRRWVLEAIDLDGIHGQGYVFQIELTFRTLRLGGRVAEVPIVFEDRTVGESKMSTAIVMEAVWQVPALRMRAVRGRLDADSGAAETAPQAPSL